TPLSLRCEPSVNSFESARLLPQWNHPRGRRLPCRSIDFAAGSATEILVCRPRHSAAQCDCSLHAEGDSRCTTRRHVAHSHFHSQTELVSISTARDFLADSRLQPWRTSMEQI